MKPERTIKAYGGFIDGKLDWIEVDDCFGGHNWRRMPSIFKKTKCRACSV